MDSLTDSIQAVMRSPASTHPPSRALTARDVMATSLGTFSASDRIEAVIDTLLDRKISGAPVVDEGGRLIGVISEGDCLRVLSSGAYDGEDRGGQQTVRDLMSTDLTTASPDTDLYALAHIFRDKRRRRLPVVEGDQLVGQVSRRDVLRAVQKMLRDTR